MLSQQGSASREQIFNPHRRKMDEIFAIKKKTALLLLHFFSLSLPAGHRVPLTMCDPWMTSLFLIKQVRVKITLRLFIANTIKVELAMNNS